jgi:RND family efflux transporter MFP subunit
MISFSLLKSLPIKQLICLLVTLLTISACSEVVETHETASNDYYQSASLITISPEQSYTIKREYLGQVTAKQHTSLGFEYSGRVSKVLVDNGDVVKKGQLLAQQDTQLINFKASELHAQIAQSQAQIALNKANLTRIKTLINNNYSSKQRLDELNAENKILKAQIDGLNARINTLMYQREKSALISPFDGVVTKRLISNGEVTSAGSPSFRIIESANNEINVGIPSKIASTLTLGQLIKIKLDKQIKQAKLIAIGQQIDSVNRTVQLRLKLIEKLEQADNFNGQLVRVTLAQHVNKAGFWIPINALTDAVRGQWQIFIAPLSTNSKNTYKLQAATVNILHSNEHSVYINGLASKQHQIVAQGVHRYVNGQIITTSSPALASTTGNK